jgi:hypothetical protein
VNAIWKHSQFAKRSTALFLAGLVIFLSLAGSSPALHKLIHSDAGEADHNCVITLFAHGHVAAADLAPIVAGLIVLFGGVVLLAENFVLSPAEYRYSASRAPPVRPT